MKTINRAFELIDIMDDLNNDDYGKMKKAEFEHRKERLNKKLSEG